MTAPKPQELPLSIPIEEEQFPGYDARNYYNARPGEILDKRYQLITKLGFGTSSTVWLAHTAVKPEIDKQYVAIKIHELGSDSHNETEISKIIRHTGTEEDRTHVRGIDESFKISGPHGHHVCLTMQPLRDPLWLLRRRLSDTEMVTADHLPFFKLYIKALLTGLDFLHKQCKVIHTDLKIDNMMFDFEDQQVIADFEAAEDEHPMARKTYPHHTVYRSHNDFGTPRGEWALFQLCPKITDFGHAMKVSHDEPFIHPVQPDNCRAPEVILGTGWSYSADMWNFGAMIYELLAGHTLFTHYNDLSGVYSAKHHLAEMTKLLGPIPSDMVKSVLRENRYWSPPMPNHHGQPATTANEFFGGPFYDPQGHLIHTDLDPPLPETILWESILPECVKEDEHQFVDFMKQMICWSPEERSTAEHLMDHPWLDLSELTEE